MAKRSGKKNSQPFDRRGGVVTMSCHFLESVQYTRLSAQAKVLITLMQIHWKSYKPVDYGIREAAQKVPCTRNTAVRVFKELREAGFIVLVDESLFSSRTQSKARTWRLTWLPFNDRPPTNDWEEREAA